MKFGVREICNVTFKTTSANQKIGATSFKYAGMPAFFIDTAKTSSMEQGTTTVYATGGRGNTRLISWEGEKTMTFTVEDALISPMGLAVLSGAGLYKAGEDNRKVHVHVSMNATTDANGIAAISLAELCDEIGLTTEEVQNKLYVCDDAATPCYGVQVDGSGYGYKFLTDKLELGTVDSSNLYTKSESATEIEVTVTNKLGINTAVKSVATYRFDFYIVLSSGASQIEIKPEDFGGFFYVEADTLFRREDSGKDMAATITFPKVKVQSGFTFSMASSGDPSTFTFTMDAFPGYTKFNHDKKVMCSIDMVGIDGAEGDTDVTHSADHSSVG